MRRSGTAFLASATVFLGLDSLRLEAMADRLYRPALAHLMRERFDTAAAAAFYAIYLAGMWFFAVLPARGWRAGLARGAAFGLVAYATYDLTNQATLRGWPWHVTLADLLWGALVTGVSAALGAALRARAQRRSR
ncbi:MAG: DUF2177 family protein [Rhizobacter sp.]|nr:DUF2177 family protein [Rhizobacter sp.]